jgi:hypothetical protein
VFPTPRAEWGPVTDRSIPLFRDSAVYFKNLALHDPKRLTEGGGAEEAASSPSARSSVTSRPSPQGPQQSSRLAASGKALFAYDYPDGVNEAASVATMRQRAFERSEHERLSKQKGALEAQLRELDGVIAFKDGRKARHAAAPKADRPFANFVDTFRCLPEHGPVTPTIAGGWLREKNS